MIELPLFPLNTVLFPGMPINLHIFEDRYKTMINSCIDKRQPFGIVLIESGVAEYGPQAEPHMIGCTAHITQVQPLGQGRMNIAAVGRERFVIRSLHRDKSYLVGMVEMYPLPSEDPRAIVNSSERLRMWVNRYLKILERAGQVQFDTSQLPNEAMPMAYLAAVLLQVSPLQKQKLLAAEHALSLLSELRSIYRREVALLEALLSPPELGEPSGPFSPN